MKRVKRAPIKASAAPKNNTYCQEPNKTIKNPVKAGAIIPATVPDVFMIPDNVPADFGPISIGSVQNIVKLIPRQVTDNVMYARAAHSLGVYAPNAIKIAVPKKEM